MKTSTHISQMIICAFCLSWLAVTTSWGQSSDQLINQRQQIYIAPLFQSWSGDDVELSQYSTSFYGYTPFGRDASLSVQFQQASTSNGNDLSLSGADLGDPGGISDIQLLGNYYLKDLNTLLGAGLSFPAGESALPVSEFRTVLQMSNDLFGFTVPVFNQGVNFSLNGSWVFKLSPSVVAGLGLGYDLKGGFDLVDGISSEYSPGNEFSITGGMDFVLNRTSSLAADVLLTFYGKDQFSGEDIYEAGQKIRISGTYQKYVGFHQYQINAAFRSRAKGNLILLGRSIEEALKSSPNQFELDLNYRHRLSADASLGFLLESRFFQESVDFPSGQLFGLGIEPTISINNNISIPFRTAFRFTSFGDPEDGTSPLLGSEGFSGWEIGAGLQWRP